MDADITDFFQKAIEHTAESIFLINAAGTVIFAAHEPNKQLEGKTFLKAISRAHHERISKAINNAFSSKRATTCDFKGTIGDSRSAWFSCRISPLLKGNEVSSALVFASDITKCRDQNLNDKKKKQKAFDKLDTFDDNAQLEDLIYLENESFTAEEIDRIAADENYKRSYEDRFQNRLYTQLLLSLTHESFTESEAKNLWEKIVSHMQDLNKKLGRKVGISVATMDYLSNISDALSDPKIIEENKSDFVAETSTNDELTGLYLRDVFNVVLEKETEKAKRKGTPVCLMMIDIDDFKLVNDKYGHQTGDSVLTEIGRIINESIRDMDCAARYGGEELAIIMPDTKNQDAYEAAQRIRKQIMEKHFSGFNVTVSVGLSCSQKPQLTPDDIIKAADNGLYESKKNGKNRVTISHL